MTSERYKRQRAKASGIFDHVMKGVAQGIPADQSLATLFKKHKEYGSRDRRLYAHAIFAGLRWLGWTNDINPPDTESRLAWSAIIDAESTIDDIALWRDAIRPTGIDVDRFTGLSLEEKIKNLVAYFPGHGFRAENLLPDWTESVIESSSAMQSLVKSCLTRPPAWIRVAPSDQTAMSRCLTDMGIRHYIHPVLSGAMAITSAFSVGNVEKRWGKAIHVQDISSQAVVNVCSVRKGEAWWDTCCGAGGKSIGLAQATGSDGYVLCTDVRETVLNNLIRRVQGHKITCVETHCLDARTATSGRRFDGILLDAPCSGIGTWPRNPDARLRMDADAIMEKSKMQSAMLNNAARFLKQGGTMVYSVCTLTETEGAHIIDHFLRSHPDFIAEEFINPLTGELVDGKLLILPGDGPGDGMFIARLKKT
ncbi:MAG TPA: RsmB/NOP family class I SAM-dependent RNA methyltransferase [Kiritimatiellia bacterium]|nr:RsmB/NOP family class I SAM-dependent RNA methyltransferase [Kiritimatiellia bacterium]